VKKDLVFFLGALGVLLLFLIPLPTGNTDNGPEEYVSLLRTPLFQSSEQTSESLSGTGTEEDPGIADLENEYADVPPFDVTDIAYIRTDLLKSPPDPGFHLPCVWIVRTHEELQAYILSWQEIFDLSGTQDGRDSFLEYVKRYDSAYFQNNALILLLVEEPSGSIRHRLEKIEAVPASDGSALSFSVSRISPYGTEDMAQWHFLIETRHSSLPETLSGAGQLTVDGQKTDCPLYPFVYNGGSDSAITRKENDL